MSPKTEVIVENQTPTRWQTIVTTLRANAGIILQLLTLGLVCTVLFVVLRHDAHPPGPGPTPDPEPSALHPIIAPKEVSAPVEEETPITVKALGPVKFAASGNVIIRQSGMTAHVMPMIEGQHKVLVTMDAGGWWWDRHDAAFVWVLVKTAKPPPPVPPGPEPKPPGPTPTSDFEKAVFAAYAGEPLEDKSHTKTLAKLYRAASKQAVQDRQITKVVELFAAVQTVRRQAIGEALPKTRAVVNAEFSKTLPNTTAALLTDELRNKAGQLFDEAGAALEKLP